MKMKVHDINTNPNLKLTYIYLAVLSLFFLSSMGIVATYRPLWYDEFFSLYVSRLSSLGEILNALINMVDNHPPLDYVFRYFSMKAFGENPLAFRLPSLFFFLIGSLFLYKFVAYRTDPLSAWVVFCFPILTIALRYAHEGRPYGLLFATACMALFSWQRSAEEKNRYYFKGLLFVALTAGCYTHLYGVFNILPIFTAEIYRIYRAEKKEYGILAVVFLACVCIVFLYPFAINASNYLSHFWAGAKITPPIGYIDDLFPHMAYPMVSSLLLFFCVIILFPAKLMKKRDMQSVKLNRILPVHELLAAIFFCLIPFFQYLAAVLATNALTPRYAITAVSGVSILFGYICFYIRAKNPLLPYIIVFCFTLSSLYIMVKTVKDTPRPKNHLDPSVIEFIQKANLPVFISGSHNFLFYYHYAPREVKDKIGYLIDRDMAIQFDGHDTDYIGIINLKKIEPLRLIPYRGFDKDAFYIIAKHLNDGWLMKKTKNDHRGQKVNLTPVLMASKDFVLKVTQNRPSQGKR